MTRALFTHGLALLVGAAVAFFVCETPVGQHAAPVGGTSVALSSLNRSSVSDSEAIIQRLRAEKKAVRKQLGALSCSVRGVGPTGGFCLDTHSTDVGSNSALAVSMATKLFDVFNDATVINLGAGMGQYEAFWHDLRAQRGGVGGPLKTAAFDGAENIEEATGGRVTWADLTEEGIDLGLADWVVSLEVAEHIPADKEAVFLSNLHRHNRKGIVMSWAVPGQDGHHHVNNQAKEAVLAKMGALGYAFDGGLTTELRSLAEVRRESCHETVGDSIGASVPVITCAPWLANTVYFFRRSIADGSSTLQPFV